MQWLNIGHTQLEMGLPEEARQSFLKVVEHNSGQIEAIHGLTAAAFELGDVAMAERMARRSIEVDPENPDAHHNLGVILLSLHRADAALSYFETALSIDGEEPRYLFSAAVAVARLGRLDEAFKRAESACEAFEGDATPFFEFVRDILSLADISLLLAFVERVKSDDPRWGVIRPLFEYLVHALRRSNEGQDDRVSEFLRALREAPEIVPVIWDFDEVERLTLGLESPNARVVERMIAVLEGRKDVTVLEDKP